jgi:hypothetical protein
MCRLCDSNQGHQIFIMDNILNLDHYNNFGYEQFDQLYNERDLAFLREQLEKEFEKKNYPPKINLFDISNKEIIKKIIGAYNNSQILEIIKTFENKFNTKVSILPEFTIQRNYHVNIKKNHGWHRDCGGELSYSYCNKLLGDNKYVFAKAAIYLQENKSYGGAIDLIPMSHTHIKKKNFLFRKIKGIPLKILFLLYSFFPKMYNFLNSSLFFYFLGGKKIDSIPGQFVLFDSRIVHRGSPILKKEERRKIEFESKYEYQATIPKEYTKFSIYAHFGNSMAVDSYIFDRSKRNNNSDELTRWNKQKDKVKEFSPELHARIASILNKVNENYQAK